MILAIAGPAFWYSDVHPEELRSSEKVIVSVNSNFGDDNFLAIYDLRITTRIQA